MKKWILLFWPLALFGQLKDIPPSSSYRLWPSYINDNNSYLTPRLPDFGAALPAEPCSTGKMFNLTTATAGQNLYFCLDGAWVQMTVNLPTGVGDVIAANDNALSGNNTFTGNNDFSGGGFIPPQVAFADLPAAASSAGKVYIITDALLAGSCAAGGGTARTICRSTGAAWESLGHVRNADTGTTGQSFCVQTGEAAYICARNNAGTLEVVDQAGNPAAITALSIALTGTGPTGLAVIAGDPATPANGDVWYNSSTNKFRKYENGAAADLEAGGLTTASLITEERFWKVAEYDGQVPAQRVLVTTAIGTYPASGVIGTAPWRVAVLNFSATAINYMLFATKLHSGWASTADTVLTLHHTQTAGVASGNALWRVNTACVAAGEDILTEPTWNADQDQAIAEPTLNTETVTPWTLTMTGCAAGELLFIRVGRIGDDVADTGTHSSSAIGLGLSYKRTLQ